MTKHLKHSSKGLVLCMCMTFFCSCHQSEMTSVVSDNLEMSIVASISNLETASQSRYLGNEPNAVQFGVGDCIGVFVDETEPIKWTYGSSGWATDGIVYWPDKTDEHVFRAFYPYSESAALDHVPMPGLKQQDGTMPGIANCDFLVAETTQSYGTDGVVEFVGTGKSFVHVSSLLKLTLKGNEDLMSSTIKKISITGKDIVASSSYSFLDKEVTLYSDASSDILETDFSHAMNGADASFFFILNAKSDVSSVVTLAIEYTTGDRTYVASMENFAGNVFTAGVQQSYTISVKDSYLIVSGAEISPWGEGESLDDIIINGREKA